MKNFKRKKIGFTLIELIVVIAIIGLLSTVGLVALKSAREKSRDTKRIADIKTIETALELFYSTYNRYPDNVNDGISTEGEVVGDGAGVFETVIEPFLQEVPGDPLYDGTFDEVADYFYAYDPSHSCPSSPSINKALSINTFETQAAFDDFGKQEVTLGSDMLMNTADYSRCLLE